MDVFFVAIKLKVELWGFRADLSVASLTHVHASESECALVTGRITERRGGSGVGWWARRPPLHLQEG